MYDLTLTSKRLAAPKALRIKPREGNTSAPDRQHLPGPTSVFLENDSFKIFIRIIYHLPFTTQYFVPFRTWRKFISHFSIRHSYRVHLLWWCCKNVCHHDYNRYQRSFYYMGRRRRGITKRQIYPLLDLALDADGWSRPPAFCHFPGK
jgi:hypothetical protein